MTPSQQSRAGALARRLGFLVGIDWIEETMRRRLRGFYELGWICDSDVRVFDNDGGGAPPLSFKVVI